MLSEWLRMEYKQVRQLLKQSWLEATSENIMIFQVEPFSMAFISHLALSSCHWARPDRIPLAPARKGPRKSKKYSGSQICTERHLDGLGCISIITLCEFCRGYAMNIRSLEFIRHIWAIWVMDNRPELRFHDRPPTEICVSSPSVAEVKQGSSQRAPQETSETAYSKIDMAIGYFFFACFYQYSMGYPN